MKKPFKAYLPLGSFILTILLAGFNAIGVRYIVQELPPFWGAAIRFGPAALLLFLLVLLFKLPIPRGKALFGAIFYGILNFGLCYALLYYGLKNVLPGMTQVLLALVPLFTVFLTIAHRQETFRWRALLGSLLAVGGIALVFREQVKMHVPVLSLLAVVGGAACFAEAGVFVKGLKQSHPVTTNAIGMASGSLILLVLSLAWGENWALPVLPATWAALAFLIVIGSCTVFMLALYTLRHFSASTLSYQFVLMPFVTLAASAWLVGEQLSPILIAGAGLVLLGVFFGVLYSPRKREVESAPILKPGNEKWVDHYR
jgi:drug/metabolite transporter (DMT)-like permease